MTKLLAACVASTLLLVGCGGSTDKQEEETTSASTTSTSPKDPGAPELSAAPTEILTVDKKAAKKLVDSGDKTADKWFVDHMEEAGITMDSTMLLVVRDDICASIDNGGTMYSIVNKTLAPYNLTGEQAGTMITGALFSSCYNAQLAVPAGTNNQFKSKK